MDSPRPRKRLALFDIDGVLANDVHRQHHAIARRWAEYFGLMHLDTVWEQGRELYEKALKDGWDVGYLTGRREDTREVTVDWLKKNNFDHRLKLIMRPERERAPLSLLKQVVVEKFCTEYDEVILYDDDPAVIQAVGERGSHCAWHTKPEAMVRRSQT